MPTCNTNFIEYFNLYVALFSFLVYKLYKVTIKLLAPGQIYLLTRIELIERFGGWFYGMLLPKILLKSNSDIVTKEVSIAVNFIGGFTCVELLDT